MLSSLRSRASGPACRKLVTPRLPHSPCVQLLYRQQVRNRGDFERSSQEDYERSPRSFSGGPRDRFGGGDRRGGGDRFGRSGYSNQAPDRFDRSSRFGRDSDRKPSRFPRAMEGEDEILDGTVEARTDYTTQFADLKSGGQIAPVLIDTITRKMGFETMTPVQSKTINETLGGIDVIAQARTGTGKTLAFLLPILQSVLAKDPSLAEPQRGRGRRFREPDIRAVIISPTRELAEQIAAEANELVANTSIAVQTAVGGTLKKTGLENIMSRGCNLLVGTPGRLKDIFSDPFCQIDLSKVSGFVLDEADRLLDDGFFPDIKDIESYLPPKESRHNMLFSATVPREVLKLAQEVLKPDSRFVQTIEKGEAQTHEKIPQNLVKLAGLENMLPALAELVVSQKDRPEGSLPFKALVFINANAEVVLYSEIFRRMSRDLSRLTGTHLPILEMHSRLSQPRRTLAASRFRSAEQAIMFSSDVSARGMDYPNVSHVIQLGAPRTRDFYIHRVGRTGRGEKSGESWLFVSPLDTFEARKLLRNLPLKENKSLQCAAADLRTDVSPEVQEIRNLTTRAAEGVDPLTKSEAYRAALGYMSFVGDKKELMESLNDQATLSWGLNRAPGINPALATKLGVRKHAVLEDAPRDSGRFGRSPRDSGGFGRSPRDSGGFGRFSRDSRGDQGSRFGESRDTSRPGQLGRTAYTPRTRAWA